MYAQKPDDEAIQNFILYGKPFPVPPDTIESITENQNKLKRVMDEEDVLKVKANPDQYYCPYRIDALNYQAWKLSIFMGYSGAWMFSIAVHQLKDSVKLFRRGVSPFHFAAAFMTLFPLSIPLSRKLQGLEVSDMKMSDYAQFEKKLKLLQEKN